MSRVRVAVLASGSGTTFENLVLRSRDGRLDAEIVRLIADRECGAVEKAHRLKVPAIVIPWEAKSPKRWGSKIAAALAQEPRPDLVCMGGFLRLWRVRERWIGRVLNIHPALLPAFGGKGMHGRHVHEAVLASGATESGCTVHLASNEYDAGPIIVQKRVRVLPGDTPESLAARVFAAECDAYPEAIRLIADSMQGRRAEVADR